VAGTGHVHEDLLVANEIERGRKRVRSGSQERYNDVGDKHEDSIPLTAVFTYDNAR
jgi:hypothetical protein